MEVFISVIFKCLKGYQPVLFFVTPFFKTFWPAEPDYGGCSRQQGGYQLIKGICFAGQKNDSSLGANHPNPVPMTMHADQRYLEGLLRNDTLLVQEIYQRFAPKIKYYVLQNQGSEDDAADIFPGIPHRHLQPGKHKNLQLTCPLNPSYY